MLMGYSSANDVVWNYYLQNPGSSFFEDFLRVIGISTQDTDTLLNRQFSVCHRIVLGLSNLDLDEYLSVVPKEVDLPDQAGKTPLAWAASRPNHAFVEILLKHGSSLQQADRRKQTPLHYCAGSGSAVSMEMMLKVAKSNALALPTTEKSDTLQGYFDKIINARDSKGRTPLNFATRMNFPLHVELLVAAGADLECADEPLRRTILMTTIYWNSIKVLPTLLRSNARTDAVDARNATILHYAARYASQETLAILAGYDLGSIDTDARDDAGLTALEIFESTGDRMAMENELQHAACAASFTSILDKCKRHRVINTSDPLRLVVGEGQFNEECGDLED